MNKADFYNKSLQWFNGIEKEASTLVINTHIYREVGKIIKSKKNLQKPSSFYDMLRQTYITSTAMGIRSIADDHRDAISLVTLLNRLIKNKGLYTRQCHHSLWGAPCEPNINLDHVKFNSRDEVEKYVRKMHLKNHAERANRLFNEYAGKSMPHISDVRIKRDLHNLKNKVAKIDHYADKVLAHNDKRGADHIPTYNEMFGCSRLIERLVIKYSLLLKAGAPSKLLPTWQYDWKQIFYTPWVTKRNK
jgi:hypothetical protein